MHPTRLELGTDGLPGASPRVRRCPSVRTKALPENSQARLPTMFRYSLKSLMLLVFAVCLFCGVFVVAPPPLTAVAAGLLYATSLPAAIGGIVYLRGYLRAFCIGSCVPVAVLWTGLLIEDGMAGEIVEELLDFRIRDRAEFVIFFALCVLVIACCGLATTGMRYWGQRLANNTRATVPANAGAERINGDDQQG